MMTAALQLLLLLISGDPAWPFDLPLDLEVIVDLERVIDPMELDILLPPLVYSSATEGVYVLSTMHIHRQHLVDFTINRLHTLLFS